MMPRFVESLGPTVRAYGKLEEAVVGADVILMLRIQTSSASTARCSPRRASTAAGSGSTRACCRSRSPTRS